MRLRSGVGYHIKGKPGCQPFTVRVGIVGLKGEGENEGREESGVHLIGAC